MSAFDFGRNALATLGIFLIALFLGLWQRFDQRSRESDPNPLDRDYFRRQDRRRYLGVAVMAALGIVIYPFIGVFYQPRGNERTLGALGLVVGALIIALLVLAHLDWLAIRQYARRHRRALEQERSRLLFELMHKSSSSDTNIRSAEKKQSAQSKSTDN